MLMTSSPAITALPFDASPKEMSVFKKYRPISHYGIIGNGKTAALVSLDGSIDWFCAPRFDSPAIFGALLDAQKGGTFAIKPREKAVTSQHYEKDTSILITEFSTEKGRAEILDFMHYTDRSNQTDQVFLSSIEIHRRVRCLDGKIDFEVLFFPRFDYGKEATLSRTKGSSLLVARPTRKQPSDSSLPKGGGSLVLATTLPFEIAEESQHAYSAFQLQKDEETWLVASYSEGQHPQEEVRRRLEDYNCDEKLAEVRKFWRKWVADCRYDGLYRDEVIRSAITLKLLSYSPNGAIVAAATTSLPEEIGGVRNWDYRYSWLRDSTFSLWAFHNLKHRKETKRYLHWIGELIGQKEGRIKETPSPLLSNPSPFSGVSAGLSAAQGLTTPGQQQQQQQQQQEEEKDTTCPIQVMYGLGGERDLSEKTLDYLEGYKGSRPVRIGNAAYNQMQLDVFGILIDAAYFAHKHGRGLTKQEYDTIVKPLAKQVELRWATPDSGIWEIRGEPRQFVYSKMWCFVAMDRAAKIAMNLGLDEDAKRWKDIGVRIRKDILQNGWDEEQGTFVQAYGSKALDAANLLMPHVRFLDWEDERVIKTVEEIRERLTVDGLVHRYLNPDGLPGAEGAFLICSFWLVDCLVNMGKVKEGKEIFERLLTFGNHLCLFSEECDPHTREALGNFPQAFTHMGLIVSASMISAKFDILKKRGTGHAGPVEGVPP
jgi:GH15 family glucan-1,4-alpha-glucosidase